jgi:hypothetical protein
VISDLWNAESGEYGVGGDIQPSAYSRLHEAANYWSYFVVFGPGAIRHHQQLTTATMSEFDVDSCIFHRSHCLQ